MKIVVLEEKEVEAKTLAISAKVRDCFSAELLDENKNTIYNYEGYVPDFMPGKHFGDYLMLDIDIDTGQILNWKKPSSVQLEDFIQGEED